MLASLAFHDCSVLQQCSPALNPPQEIHSIRSTSTPTRQDRDRDSDQPLASSNLLTSILRKKPEMQQLEEEGEKEEQRCLRAIIFNGRVSFGCVCTCIKYYK